MTIDRFTLSEFEAALPRRKSDGAPLWEHHDSFGEHVYFIHMDDPNGRYLEIRSSIKEYSEVACDTGENSIRVYIKNPDGGLAISQPALKSMQGFPRWTTRVPGWKDRLYQLMSELRQIAATIPMCPRCQRHMMVQKGRFGPYARCTVCGETGNWKR